MLIQRELDLVCESIEVVDDGDLIELYVRTHETQYVAELVRRHYRLVATVVGRVVVDSHDAQDAVQTTFLVFCSLPRGFESVHRLPPGCMVSPTAPHAVVGSSPSADTREINRPC